MSGPLLVIAHEATRTGSPRVLLELMRFARTRLPVPVAVELLAAGPLADELRAVATPSDPADRPAAVLVNGAAGAAELDRFDRDVPGAVYVHEQGDALEVLPAAARDALVDRADLVLTVSQSSLADLVALGVAGDRIVVLPPVVTVRSAPSAAAIADARSVLGATDGRSVVVGCGEAGWRKGADLFVDVARRLSSRDDLGFAWLGGRSRSFGRVLDHDTDLVGLAGRLHWIGEVGDPAPLLAAASVLVMTSREDPQPLVPLEAALVGVPTAGFAIGGIVDLAVDGAALTAPYPDTVALAARVIELVDDTDVAERTVANARDRLTRLQSIDVVGPRFVEVIGRLVESTGRDAP